LYAATLILLRRPRKWIKIEKTGSIKNELYMDELLSISFYLRSLVTMLPPKLMEKPEKGFSKEIELL
jgi:hypothetical protein